MNAAPPRWLETVVGILLPPACREPVLGDLHERYRSTRSYLAEALHTLPLVIASQVRRAADPQVLLLEAFALYASFLGAAWRLEGSAFLYEQEGFLRLAIPAAAALVTVTLADAYAAGAGRSPRSAILEAAVAVGLAFASQAPLLAAGRQFAVPPWTLVTGGGMSMLLLAGLRVLFPPGANRPGPEGRRS